MQTVNHNDPKFLNKQVRPISTRLDQGLRCQGVQHRMDLVVNYFGILKLFCFASLLLLSDLVHDVEVIHGLC